MRSAKQEAVIAFTGTAQHSSMLVATLTVQVLQNDANISLYAILNWASFKENQTSVGIVHIESANPKV
jgi:hypothetical protein